LSNIETAKSHGVERSRLRSIFIVVTCTAAMVVNVSLLHTIPRRSFVTPLLIADI
jgi:hypothetical protein